MEDTIARVKRMEEAFDRFRQTRDPALKDLLAGYMESGLWRSDYMADERGELPRDLKRGVLSEDGLYNLLWED